MRNFNVNLSQIPSLKPQILAQLQTAIEKNNLVSEPTTIPLTRAKNTIEIIYLSPIALKLASSQNDNKSNQLADYLSTRLNSECLNFNIEVIAPGWLKFQSTPMGLATWLQNLISTSLVSPFPPSMSASNSSSLFTIQYTHARCCSLLQTGHRENLIILEQNTHQIITPEPIPWLNSSQKLRFQEYSENALISRLADTLDSLATGTLQNPLKVATSLCEAFSSFHSSCRIWGEIKTQNPELSQARLGLIRATQNTLQFILQNFLATEAPTEL